jgi:hypothetical protein
MEALLPQSRATTIVSWLVSLKLRIYRIVQLLSLLPDQLLPSPACYLGCL